MHGPLPPKAEASWSVTARVRLDQPLNDPIEAIERMLVMRALDRAHGNDENAAKLRGISRSGLFLERRRWGTRRAS